MPNPKISTCFGGGGSKWASLGTSLAAGAAFNQRLRIRRPSVGWATRLPNTDLSWLGDASYCSFLTMSLYIFVATCLMISWHAGAHAAPCLSAWLELALLLPLPLASVLTAGAERAGLGCEGLGLLDLLSSELPVLLRSTSKPVSSRMTMS